MSEKKELCFGINLLGTCVGRLFVLMALRCYALLFFVLARMEVSYGLLLYDTNDSNNERPL